MHVGRDARSTTTTQYAADPSVRKDGIWDWGIRPQPAGRTNFPEERRIFPKPACRVGVWVESGSEPEKCQAAAVMTTRASRIWDRRNADIVGQVLALTPGHTLALSLIEVSMAFGEGDTGLSRLREIAEDHDCYVGESDVLGVTITKTRPR
jgi:hypothetical protein